MMSTQEAGDRAESSVEAATRPAGGVVTEVATTTGRVLLLKPGDHLIIAGVGAIEDVEHHRFHDAIAELKERLNLGAVWVFSVDINIATAEIVTRLKIEEAS